MPRSRPNELYGILLPIFSIKHSQDIASVMGSRFLSPNPPRRVHVVSFCLHISSKSRANLSNASDSQSLNELLRICEGYHFSK
ncbi:hypothetical protein Pla144_38140 [Bythopirellula polymerisocia]|uniref:Uncharacterized protein n=1 Tax=Bythopirellula polymerisocia TaxID=2528003 RepID=A0A5C6CLC8_9BACT|nr:hypothetical protein Pla144_38140 [Bythopirellula polymerisocia]